MADEIAQEVVRDWGRLDGDAGTWLSHCQQVALYLDPDRADFTTEKFPGTRRQQYVFDATPLFAHETGAALLHGMYTSDTLPWFSTIPEDDRLQNDADVMRWFQIADAADYAVFNNPERNFTTQSHQTYLDLLAYGGGCTALLRGLDGGALFTNRHLRECRFAENEEDKVDQVSRRWKWTAKQAHDRWGRRAGDKVSKAIADGKFTEPFWFHHRVKPRAMAQRDPQRADALNKVFESVYVCEDDLCVIEQGGFDLFPYLCPRLSKRTPQDVMGRGRGMMLLPDIKMLNRLAALILRSAEKIIDPPLMLPDDGFIVPIKSGPSALNYHRPGLRPDDKIQPILTGGNVPIGMEMLTRLEGKVEHGFHNDLLATPTDPSDPASAGKGVTATFTENQTRQQRQRLAPLNSRLDAEWAAPLVIRMRAMNWQISLARRFGEGSPYTRPPPQLSGKRWRPHFRSPIALAQRAAEMSAIDQLWQRQLFMKQMDPNAPMIMDAEATMRLEARDLNAPVEVLKSPRMLAAEAAIRAQRDQQLHEAAIAEQGAGAAASMAQAHGAMAQAGGGQRRAA